MLAGTGAVSAVRHLTSGASPGRHDRPRMIKAWPLLARAAASAPGARRPGAAARHDDGLRWREPAPGAVGIAGKVQSA